jgi:hypothetical protein
MAQARAARVLSLPGTMFNHLLRQWRNGLNHVWAAPDPAAVLAEMGTRAGEVFTRSAQLAVFLEQQLPGSTDVPEAKLIKPTTIHPDGTVTINPPAPAAGSQ